MVYYLGLKRDHKKYPENEFLDGYRSNIALEGSLTLEVKVAAGQNQTRQVNVGYSIEPQSVSLIWCWTSNKEIPDFCFP